MAVTVSIKGGDKYKAFLDKMAEIAGGVKAGILGDATQAKIGGASIAAYAVYNEFGATIRVTPKMRAYMHYNGVHLKSETTVITYPRALLCVRWRKATSRKNGVALWSVTFADAHKTQRHGKTL